MEGYSDRKLHVADFIDGTITEIQHLERWPNNSWRAHGVTQYDLAMPSAWATGRSAAKYPLAESVLRYDDIVTNGSTYRTTVGINCASAVGFLWPAQGTDGLSYDPAAPPMGAVLRLRPEAAARLNIAGRQAAAIARCLAGPGAMIIDSTTAPHGSFNLEPDPRWDQVQLAAVRALKWSDFDLYQLTEA
jgi:hypothetical protein